MIQGHVYTRQSMWRMQLSHVLCFAEYLCFVYPVTSHPFETVRSPPIACSSQAQWGHGGGQLEKPEAVAGRPVAQPPPSRE